MGEENRKNKRQLEIEIPLLLFQRILNRLFCSGAVCCSISTTAAWSSHTGWQQWCSPSEGFVLDTRNSDESCNQRCHIYRFICNHANFLAAFHTYFCIKILQILENDTNNTDFSETFKISYRFLAKYYRFLLKHGDTMWYHCLWYIIFCADLDWIRIEFGLGLDWIWITCRLSWLIW